jgi:hypothetical protein
MKRNLYSQEFVPQALKRNRFRTSSQRAIANDAGLTLVELLVGASVGVIVVGMALTGALVNRQFFLQDLVNGDRSQTVREAVDLVGLDLMQVGQNLGSRREFPAVQVTREATGNNSRLIVRKNSLVPLTMCEAPASGTAAITVAMRVERQNSTTLVWEDFTPELTDANGDGIADERANNVAFYKEYDASQLSGCEYDPSLDRNSNGWQDNTLEKWLNYRSDNGGTASAFLFGLVDPDTSVPGNEFSWGQRFTYSGEAAPAATTRPDLTTPNLNKKVRIRKFTISSTDAWQQPNGTVALSKMQGLSLYIAETREYRLENNSLTLRVNGGNPVTLVTGLSRFAVRVIRNDDNQLLTVPEDFCWRGAENAAALGAAVPADPTSCNLVGWSATKINNNSWSKIRSIDVLVQTNDPANPGLIRENSATDPSGFLTRSYFPRSIFSFPS